MADVWKGFTEEDIGFFQKNREEKNENSVPNKKASNLLGDGERKAKKEKIFYKSQAQSSTIENEIPESAKLLNESTESVPKIEEKEKKTENLESKEKGSEIRTPIVTSNPVCLKIMEGNAYELVDKNSTELSKATLDIFEARQKKLEEQNRKKKELLAKVVSARKKQTSEEAKRLQHIQEELQKLDLLLSNEVGILRNKIEEVSWDFVEAQKRYNRAEKEFLEAKQNLFGKLEKKELLTKLLCTIIEQNELRKAQKLSELMEKLEIKEGATEFPSDYQSALMQPTENTDSVETSQVNQPS